MKMQDRIAEKLRAASTRRKVTAGVACMLAVVMVGTTAMLTLTGKTQTQYPVCGWDDHLHTDECYATPLACTFTADGAYVHVHGEGCYDADGEIVCPLEQVPAHVHTDVCYQTGEGSHVHTPDCYGVETVQVCGQDEVLAHFHVTECYDEAGQLACGELEGHRHSEGENGCYDDEGNLICGREEHLLHAHTADCYEIKYGVLVCGQEESGSDEVVRHVHTLECYEETDTDALACDLEESEGHAHTADCYTAENNVHVHTADCFERVTEAHEHSAACYEEEQGDLTCTQEEFPETHVHTDDCHAIETVVTCGLSEEFDHDLFAAPTCGLEDSYEYDVNDIVCGQEEGEGHVHSDEAQCYARTYHQHEDSCYPLHEHTAACSEELPTGDLACEYAAYPDGVVEHEHGHDCYEWHETLVCLLDADVHDCDERGCNVAVYGDLICTEEEGPEHVHDVTCYGEPSFVQTCQYERVCGFVGDDSHVHDDTCFEKLRVLSCGEAEDHVHGDECWDEAGELVCDLPGHVHDDTCYEDVSIMACEYVLACGIEESEGHAHSAENGCYAKGLSLSCGRIEGETEAEPVCGFAAIEVHEHGPECLVSVDSLHVHTAACFDESGMLLCGSKTLEDLEAAGYEMDDNGYVYVCGKPEVMNHVHGDGCFGESEQVESNLVCGYHTHTEACFNLDLPTVTDPVDPEPDPGETEDPSEYPEDPGYQEIDLTASGYPVDRPKNYLSELKYAATSDVDDAETKFAVYAYVPEGVFPELADRENPEFRLASALISKDDPRYAEFIASANISSTEQELTLVDVWFEDIDGNVLTPDLTVGQIYVKAVIGGDGTIYDDYADEDCWSDGKHVEPVEPDEPEFVDPVDPEPTEPGETTDPVETVDPEAPESTEPVSGGDDMGEYELDEAA